MRFELAGSVRRTTLRGALALALLACGMVAPGAAADSALPDGAKILDAYAEASGGIAAHRKIRSRVMHGTMSVVGMDLSGEVTVSHADGNMYFVWEAPAFGKVENGVHEDVAWEITPMTGARVKEGAERRSALRVAALDHTSNWRKYYAVAECVGVETIEGRSCFKVRVDVKGESPSTHWYDTKTGLLTQIQAQHEGAHGTMNLRIVLDDYREVDGVRVPFKTTHTLNDQQTMVLEIASVKHNVEIPAERFALPEVIVSKLEPRRTQNTQ